MDFYRHAVSFPGLGIGEFEINQTAFTIPGIDWPVRWYGVIIAAGFLLAIFYILKRTRTFGLDADRVLDVIIGGVIGGIVGARLYYVIFSWEIYADDPISIFYLWKGGIAIYGGVIGGFLAGYLICRWRKVKFLPMADLAVGGLILAQSIGRWGNFVNIEAFGSNTTAPWGMAGPAVRQYLASHQAALAAQGVVVDPSLPVHPTFFYESVWCLLGFLFIAWYTRRRRFDGELTLVYAAWYGAGRAVIEGLRTDSLMWGSVRVSQALAVVLVIAALALEFWVRGRIRAHAGDPDYLKLYVDTGEGQAVLAGTFYQQAEAPEPPEALGAGEQPAFPEPPETDEAVSEGEEPAGEPAGDAPGKSEEPETTDGEDEKDAGKAD
ncbi:prolipoprotein diacylglyceryl transferase [uncultured Anaerotruncus sp.]|uniref:prolipoprotein diacylglyceryl transferase n=1 Tax=uncultured Anaerotruncus sp. TaxID=905011 RepID=UPI00280B6231|nr:prolipoprotein diacylglyceryl transferase [uncultured Anaerotruncus sp.]